MVKIYKTPQVQAQYKRIFKETARRFGKSVALETLRQLEDAEEKLKTIHVSHGKNVNIHSDRFQSIKIKNAQILFYEHIGDDIVIVAAGWVGRNWIDRLIEMEPYIDAQLSKWHQQ